MYIYDEEVTLIQLPKNYFTMVLRACLCFLDVEVKWLITLPNKNNLEVKTL